jgi:hypothetical protein
VVILELVTFRKVFLLTSLLGDPTQATTVMSSIIPARVTQFHRAFIGNRTFLGNTLILIAFDKVRSSTEHTKVFSILLTHHTKES